MGKKTRGNKVQCEHCQVFVDKKSIVRHIRLYHPEKCEDKKEYKCEHCDEAFYIPSKLTQHLVSKHNQEPEGSSSQPPSPKPERPQNEDSSTAKLGKRTEKIKSDVCTIQCAQCPQICANIKVYHQHMKLKHTLKCDKCSYTTLHKKKLRFHVKKRHSKKEKILPTLKPISSDFASDGKQKSTCPDCGNTFTRVSDMRRHYDVVHRGIKRFKCDTCGQGFSKMLYLNKHMQRDHGIFTDQIYNQTISLDQPNDMEIDTQNYEITNERIDDLPYNHSQENGDISSVPCPYCGKEFDRGRRHDLKRHIINIHKGIKRFKCVDCPAEFSNICHLKTHSKKQHGVSEEEFKYHKNEMPDIESELPDLPEKPVPVQRMEVVPANFGPRIEVNPGLDSGMDPGMDFEEIQPKINNGFVPKIVESVRSVQFTSGMKKDNPNSIIPCTYEVCDKTFTRKGDLRRHILNVHLQFKAYKCTFCGHCFYQITDLRAHQVKVHDWHDPNNLKYQKLEAPEVDIPEDIPDKIAPSRAKISPEKSPIKPLETEFSADFYTVYFCADCDFMGLKMNDLLSHVIIHEVH